MSRPASAICLLSATLLLLLIAFHRMRGDLLIAWSSEDYGHGMIIPFIAILMGWHILTRNPQTPTPSWLGAFFLCLSSVFLLMAILAAFQAAAHYGFIIALLGCSLAFLGIPATRLLLPAFIYLFFAIPLPHLVYANLSQDLQLLSSTLGVKMLETLGISVFQEGNVIDLGLYKLQVVEACSGLRYLFPLISFGYLVAYIMQDTWWKRLIIFASAIPIAIAMNTLRITLIGITVDRWGPSMAEGFLHQFEGWVVFALCIALMLAEATLLMRSTATKGHFRFEIFGPAHGPLLTTPLQLRPATLAAFAITILMASIFGSGIIESRPEIIPDHPSFATFPANIAGWHATEQGLSPDILDSLQLTDYWLADYSKKDIPSPINLYIAYYATQHLGSSTHSPSHCIPGGGWQVENKSLLTITLKDGTPITVTRMLIRRGDAAQLVYFWFDERGRTMTETSYAKWYLFTDAITMGRSDGALIRLVTPIDTTENIAVADQRLQDFMEATHPIFSLFIPGKTLPQTLQSPAPRKPLP